MRQFLFFIGLVLIFSCHNKGSHLPLQKKEKHDIQPNIQHEDVLESVKFVVLGSSTAAGTGPLDIRNSWVNRYRRHLHSHNTHHEIINLAVGGYTTYQLLPTDYVVPVNRPHPDSKHNVSQAISLHPDAVLINLPSNDADKGFSIQEQLNNYRIIIDELEKHHIPVWVSTPQGRNMSLEKRKIQKELLDSTFVIFGDHTLDFWTGIATEEGEIYSTYNSGDDIHLNDEAHRLLYEIVKNKHIVSKLLNHRNQNKQPLMNDNRVDIGNYRMMTYNIRLDVAVDEENAWPHRKQFMIQQINKIHPSIIGIQEALPSQVQYLDRFLLTYNRVGIARDGDRNKEEYSAIYFDSERLDVLDQNTFWLSESPEKVSKGWDASYLRICTYAHFKDKISGNQFWVFNTHLDNDGELARKNGLALISTRIKELSRTNEPVILMGDFNMLPNDEQIRNISKRFDDCFTSNSRSKDSIGTFNNFDVLYKKDERIDYIFVNNKVEVLDYYVDHSMPNGKFVSDHFPVIVELNINKQ